MSEEPPAYNPTLIESYRIPLDEFNRFLMDKNCPCCGNGELAGIGYEEQELQANNTWKPIGPYAMVTVVKGIDPDQIDIGANPIHSPSFLALPGICTSCGFTAMFSVPYVVDFIRGVSDG